jgi:tRNA U38,U39,U40 pseudouridine synthase TruA
MNRTWDTEDSWWRQNFNARPYAAGREYEHYRGAYRYGTESANHHLGRKWDDVETDLRTGWDRYQHRGSASSTWEEIKDAVRDAWHRVTGEHDVRPRGATTGVSGSATRSGDSPPR